MDLLLVRGSHVAKSKVNGAKPYVSPLPPPRAAVLGAGGDGLIGENDSVEHSPCPVHQVLLPVSPEQTPPLPSSLLYHRPPGQATILSLWEKLSLLPPFT